MVSCWGEHIEDGEGTVVAAAFIENGMGSSNEYLSLLDSHLEAVPAA